MRRIALLIAVLCLAACAVRTEPYRTAARPDDPRYGTALPAGHTAYDNQSLADLFVLLSHGLEYGAFRPGLQRFEAPVRLGITGPGSAPYAPFVDSFLVEIAARASIDIRRGPPPHNLLVRFVPGEEFLPRTSNQCVVVFGQPTWQAFLADPGAYTGLVTGDLDRQTAMGVPIPDTLEPYRVRECLLEEIPQALGLANDLYGLGPSVFNDDNAHTWPTALDYLMLRVLYDRRLRSGLTQPETRRIARRILDEINPAGRDAPALAPIRQRAFRDWRARLQGLDRAGPIQGLREARRIAADARAKAPGTAYDCTGAQTLAALAGDAGAEDAPALTEAALAICARAHGPDDLRIAELRLGRVFAHLRAERFGSARQEAEAILPVFLAHGLDGLVAITMIALVAAAQGLDDPAWSRDMLRQAAAWSAYAFGADHDVTGAFGR